MMNAPHTSERRAPSGAVTRAQAVWLTAAQAAALALFALALFWAGATYSDSTRAALPPQFAAQVVQDKALLGLLVLMQIVVLLVPGWRRSPVAGVLGGVTLALACWFAADATITLDDPGDLGLAASYVPLMAPVMLAAAILLAAWGRAARAGLADSARLGVAAVVGGALLAALGLALYLVITFHPTFATLYTIERYQLAALLAACIVYPAAIWLGGTGLRPAGGWLVQPAGMAIIAGAFFAYWRTH